MKNRYNIISIYQKKKQINQFFVFENKKIFDVFLCVKSESNYKNDLSTLGLED